MEEGEEAPIIYAAGARASAPCWSARGEGLDAPDATGQDTSTRWLTQYSQPRLHPPRWSDPQVRPQHLPSVLPREELRHWLRQGTSSVPYFYNVCKLTLQQHR